MKFRVTVKHANDANDAIDATSLDVDRSGTGDHLVPNFACFTVPVKHANTLK